MRTAAFVINRTLIPDPARLIKESTQAARTAGWNAVFVASAQAARAASPGLVFAAGGDGTVRACARELGGTRTPLSIIPLGTANLTARTLGIPRRVRDALNTGFHGVDRSIDLARVDGTPAAAMAGIGLDASVVRATRTGTKRRAGWLAYVAAGLPRLSFPRANFTITLDDGKPLTRTACCVVVGNTGLLPGGFSLLCDARIDDGILDVAILGPHGIAEWAVLTGHILTRNRRQHRYLERYQARNAEIMSDMPLLRQADGELLPEACSLTVSAWPAALIVRVPAVARG